MARASMSIDLRELNRLSEAFQSPTIQSELEELPADKNLAAFIAQAIADNFDKQGPGWPPLKGATIRKSVSKAVRTAVQREAISKMRSKTGGPLRTIGAVRKQGRISEMHAI